MTKRNKRTSDHTKAIGYIRVSTTEQALGPEAQRTALLAWAAGAGVSIVAIFEDRGVSGAAELSERPGLLAALDAVTAENAGFLVVAKRDRIARDVVVAALVEKAVAKLGARLFSADGTANGDSPAEAFMRTVIDGASAYERALIRARTKAALQAKRAKGERVGSVAYGFELAPDGVRLVPSVNEQNAMNRARELSSGGLSLRAIAAQLASEGFTTRKGGSFQATQIARMLETSEAA